MQEHRGILELRSEGDVESNYNSGPLVSRDTARWPSFGSVMQGETDSGATILTLPVSDVATDRRRCFAVQAQGMTVKRLNPGFGWNGGTPTNPIDLDDFPATGSTTTVASVLIADLWVMTDRLYSGVLTIGSVPSGRWYFIEGETYDEFRVWDPA